MDTELLTRVRTLLGDHPGTVREVRMFGGISFMVDESLRVAVRADDDLLVHVDPERSAELLERPGAAPAMMGEREMGASWLAVAASGTATDDGLAFWVGSAVEAGPGNGASAR